MNKGFVKKPFEQVYICDTIFLESGKLIKKFRVDPTATALKRMAYMEVQIMTFELTQIIGSTFGGYQFKVRHRDSEVLKRVKDEVVKAMKDKGYDVDNVKGQLEK